MKIPDLIARIITEPDSDNLGVFDPKIVNQLFPTTYTPLDYAVRLGKPKFCAQLIAAGAAVHISTFIHAMDIVNSQIAEYWSMADLVLNKLAEQGIIKCIEIIVPHAQIISLDTNNPAVFKILIKEADHRKHKFVVYTDFLCNCKNIACIKLFLQSATCKRFITASARDSTTDHFVLETFASQKRDVPQITVFCVWMGLPLMDGYSWLALKPALFKKCMAATKYLY